jgi:O-acetyl-ADP-ribose deacetylase (regulator of RNase III)
MYSVGLDYLCLRQWGQQLVQYSSEMRGLKGGHRVDTEGVAVAARLGRHEARSISCEAANGGCKGQFVCSGQGDHEGR